jgi:ABC-type oligopeptide transport system substrate-binding subunit
MKKLMLMVAMLAIVLVAAAPAIAQVSQEFSERRDTSGSASPKAAVSNTGDNANLCPTVQQIANTGQVLNEQGVVQYFSTADDLDFSGSSLTITPSETATCTQTIEQAAAA